MGGRRLEAVFLGIIALAVLVGGRLLVLRVALFGTLSIAVLAPLALIILAAARRNAVAGAPDGRLWGARDIAFLAAIGAAIVFIASAARWALGATVVALEIGIVIALLGRLVPSERS